MKFDIKEILTLPASIMAALSLASGILLFSPVSIIEKLFMLEFREQNGFAIGIVFIVSISILTINLIYSIWKSIQSARARKHFYSTAEERLRNLTSYQKAIIYLLYIQHNRTFDLPLHDGAINELESNLMIGKATNQYMVNDLNNAKFPYLLQPWVSNKLKGNADLLEDFRVTFNSLNNNSFNN